MIYIVTINEDPIRIHLEQYDRVEKLFKPEYYFSSILGQRASFCSILKCAEDPNKRDEYRGTITIAENNKDVIIKGDPKLFLNIANEVEKLGYSVMIEY